MNKAFSLVLAACMTIGMLLVHTDSLKVSGMDAADLSDGLIGYWKFDGALDDEMLANCAANSSYTGTAQISGSGTALKSGDGISGGSVYFSKEANSYLRIPQILDASADDFTIAAWVKYDLDPFSNNNNINLFQQTSDVSQGSSAGGRTILLFKPNRQYETYLTAENVGPEASSEFGNWTHVAITSKHDAKQVQFYLNGKLTGSYDLTGEYYSGITDILIGAPKSLEARLSMKGSIDELRYYNKVVDAAAVEAMYAEFATEDYKPSKKITITVDTQTTLREISDAMFGINHRYHNDGYSSWNAQEQKIEEKFNECVKEAAFGSIRYPGGTVANLYDWKRTIGPVEERKKTIHGNPSDCSPIIPNFGVDEAMSWIYDDLGSEAVWVYAMAQGSAADAADLFEYLNAPADGDATNPNGGIDWAEVRAANGHSEPYGVTRFEIGNEMGMWGQNYWLSGCGSTVYANMANAYVNGGEMTFTKERTVQEEDWRTAAAASDGTANQVRYVKYDPVKEGSASVFVNNEKWEIVDSLEGEGAANVCTFDYETGKIMFGDGTNGNIPTSGTIITATYTSIQDGFVKYYTALKEIAKELGMEVTVYSCMEKEAAIQALQKAGSQYDGAVIHPYSETSSNGNGYVKIEDGDLEFYEKLLGRSLEHNISRVEELTELMGEGKVPVVSEFGIYNHNTKFVRSIGHAIYIANEMIDYIGLGTPYLNKHCLVDYPYGSDNLGSGAQCVIQAIKDDDGSVSFVSTPSAKAFSIFNHMTGNTQTGQTIDGNETYYTYVQSGKSYEVPTIKVLSTKDDDGNTFITVVNNRKNDNTSIEIKVDDRNLDNQEVEVWYLTSDNADDENTKDNPNLVDVEKETFINEGESLEYTLAPHSITSFKISAEKEEVIDSGKDEGLDTDNPSENEIQIKTPAVGEEKTDFDTNGKYKVISSGQMGVTAAYMGPVNASAANYVILDTVTISGTVCEVTAIADKAFLGCKSLKTVTIGKNVTKIGAKAFYKCTALKKIAISAKVSTIGKQAFCGCKKLKNITILTKSLTKKTVGKNAFKGIYAKAKVKVPSSKQKSYKTLLKARGISSKATIKN